MSGNNRPGLKPHSTDVLSLVFGLIFLGAVGWWLIDAVIGARLALGWVVAGTLIAIGGIGLYAAVRTSRRSNSQPPTR